MFLAHGELAHQRAKNISNDNDGRLLAARKLRI